MRYAIIGAKGQLGSELCRSLGECAIPLDRTQADLTRPELLQNTLEQIKPDVVINCAAYNFVDKAEAEPEQAFAVNAFGPRTLANICEKLGTTLVHWSSDHVYGLDALRRTPYHETDCPGPVSVYGASKLAGEWFVRRLCRRHFVIRTCGLYGHRGSGGKGTNFVETMLRLAREGKSIRVVGDQICTPSFTADMAAAALQIISTRDYGLYHLTNAGACSWHEFATTIFGLSDLRVSVQAVTSREYAAAAHRPAYSVLSMENLSRLGISPPRPWQDALSDYLQQRAQL